MFLVSVLINAENVPDNSNAINIIRFPSPCINVNVL